MRWTSFLERFDAIVRDFPAAVALLDQGRPITFAELSTWSAALADALRAAGAHPETLVALSLERSAAFVAGLLAAWRIRAAFLPLDPHGPSERIAYIIGASGVRLAFARPEHASQLERVGVRTLDPESMRNGPAHHFPEANPNDLAYAIYTSGSTGRPKGVLVEQRGIVPLLDAQIAAFQLGSQCRSLWFLSPLFDASISDLGTALLARATLCIEPDDELRDPLSLVRILTDRRITHIDLPPALLRVLDPFALPASLRTLIIGGEAAAPEVVCRWARRFRVVNVYGPTEATVCTSLCVCDPATWNEPLLGQPLPGVRYLVLDDELRPVPPDTSGELVIAGPCLARGYLAQPELTARKFIIHNGERFYRTSDHVLFRSDGELVFLGRMDRQVKIRGQLVEPEEIESRLLEHPSVQHAAIVKRPLTGSERAGLVAFVVPSDSALTAAALRKHLAQVLPHWMLPQRIEFVTALPRTPTGKIDWNALAAVALSSRSTASGNARTREEAVLVEVWERVLGVSVDLDASFFDLGGDSLTLLEAVTATQARGVMVPPALIAEGRSIRSLAAWLCRPARTDDVPPGARSAASLRCLSTWPGLIAISPLAPVLGGEGSGVRGLQLHSALPDPLTPDPSPPSTEARGDVPSFCQRPSNRRPHRPARSVLLTGATGFLGAHVLDELSRQLDAEIVCLVRGEPERARERLHAMLDGFELSSRRVQVVSGDLKLPHFGLAHAEWDRLADTVDAVYHCAARVHMLAPFDDLRATNLDGTREVLNLVATGRPKKLHFASTLSVFVSTDRNTGVAREDDDLSATQWIFGGYAQTKWAAEWLVRAAAPVIGPTSVYRLGLLTGHSRNGRAAPNDFLTLFLRGLARLGCVPSVEAELRVDVTPVDFAAAAMTQLSLSDAPGELMTYHLANPRSLTLHELLAAVRSFGIALAEVDATEFRGRLDCLDPSIAAVGLGLCRTLATSGDGFTRNRTMDLFQTTGITFDMTATRAALVGSGLECPAPTPELLRRYLDHIFPEGPPRPGVGP